MSNRSVSIISCFRSGYTPLKSPAPSCRLISLQATSRAIDQRTLHMSPFGTDQPERKLTHCGAHDIKLSFLRVYTAYGLFGAVPDPDT